MRDGLAGIVGLAVFFAVGAAGRWIYFHPARFWDKFYGDLELVQKPYSNFLLRFGKSFGVLILVCSLFCAAGELIALFSKAAGLPDSAPVAMIAALAITTIGSLYLLRERSSQPENKPEG